MRMTADKIRLPGGATLLVALLATVSLLVFAAPAMAQSGDPTSSQYSQPTQIVEEFGDGGGGGGGSTTSSNSPNSGLQKEVVGGLPFTGLDLIALVAVAVALTSMGVALRRLTFDHTRH